MDQLKGTKGKNERTKVNAYTTSVTNILFTRWTSGPCILFQVRDVWGVSVNVVVRDNYDWC